MHNVKRTQLGCLLCSSFANWTNRVFVPVRVFLQNIFQDLCRTLWGFLERDSEWNDIRLWSVFCTNYFYLFTTARLPLFVMAFHKEKLLSCMYIYQKVSKNHPVIKLWYIWNKIASLDLNLHQFAWNAVRLFFHMLKKHMLKWNTLWPYSWAFLLGSQNRQKFRQKECWY